MRIDYDPDAHALYITVRDAEPTFGEDVSPGVIGHYDSTGHLVGVEILDVIGPVDAMRHLTIPDPAPSVSA
ncbi:DUF2283 domain-containing protein [Sulfobacillus harzensis]|uniref:DUF2283 domain-containing protein n=1 Tax=Sulfobacillus harzensis TaxID=2729629 RepID=A0A7Y0Q5L5_9FIRM|nr:DUF2283 domain-containing protein [Sulfobacillus harzensis]